MKKFMISILTTLTITSCVDDTITWNISYEGNAKSFQELYENPAIDRVVEISTINEGNYISGFFDIGFTGNLDFGYSTDNFHFVHDRRISEGGHRFSYVIKHDNVYYMAYVVNMNMYLSKSNNGFDWTLLNSGNPIIYKSNNPDSIWYNVWNPAFFIDEVNQIHIYIECQVEAPSQSKVGISYGVGSLDNESNITMDLMDVMIIEKAGNPWVEYKNEKVYILYGDLTPSFWSISAGVINNYTEFTQVDFSIYQSKKHICDPHMVKSLDGSYMLSFSYDQNYLFNVYSYETLENIFK